MSAPALPARAIVFDLDGTLLDSFRAIHASLNHARAALGHPPLTLGQVRGLVGWGLDRLLSGAFPAAELARARDLYRAHHAETCLGLTELLPGVAETLAELDRRGFLLAVATNKAASFTRQLLGGLGLLARLDAVLGADQVREPKPHPEMLLAILAQLGAAPAEALYVGDMQIDVQTARAAGVRVVAVASGAVSRADLAEAGPDRLLDRIDQLPDLVGEAPAGAAGQVAKKA